MRDSFGLLAFDFNMVFLGFTVGPNLFRGLFLVMVRCSVIAGLFLVLLNLFDGSFVSVDLVNCIIRCITTNFLKGCFGGLLHRYRDRRFTEARRTTNHLRFDDIWLNYVYSFQLLIFLLSFGFSVFCLVFSSLLSFKLIFRFFFIGQSHVEII